MAIMANAILYVFILYSNKSTVIAKLNEYKFLPADEPFTELYFDNVATLPKEMSAGGRLDFSFTINNLEGVDTEYPYEVFFIGNSSSSPESEDDSIAEIDKNKIMIKNGEKVSIHESYKFLNYHKKGEVHVVLKNKNQELHFSLEGNK